jgi:uncharacterized SAM-binding protein YcdF (DUF218 family)
MRARLGLPFASLGVGFAAVLSWGEWVDWRASRRGVTRASHSSGSEAIVVLGYGNRGTRANYLNRYRVRAGLRSIGPQASETVLILSGGTVHSSIPEAELMAQYARETLGYTGRLQVETESRSTLENIQNVVPLIEGFDTIKIVSNSLHAEMARGYLLTLRPDLAARLARAEEYRFGEITLLKPFSAVLALRHTRQRRRASSLSITGYRK